MDTWSRKKGRTKMKTMTEEEIESSRTEVQKGRDERGLQRLGDALDGKWSVVRRWTQSKYQIWQKHAGSILAHSHAHLQQLPAPRADDGRAKNATALPLFCSSGGHQTASGTIHHGTHKPTQNYDVFSARQAEVDVPLRPQSTGSCRTWSLGSGVVCLFAKPRAYLRRLQLYS